MTNKVEFSLFFIILDKSHIIKLIDTFDFNNHICMVFELYEMNLRDLLKLADKGESNRGLPLNQVRDYAKQILLAFTLIHKFRIIHADCKNLYLIL